MTRPSPDPLLRTAFLLTGDLATARAHAGPALAEATAAASGDPGERERLALRNLVARVLSGDRGQPTSAREAFVDVDPRYALVWDVLDSLSPMARAAVVLRLDRGLDDQGIAALLDSSPQSVRREVAVLLADVAGIAGVPLADAGGLVVATLRDRGDRTAAEPHRLVDGRFRHRRATGLVVAVALAVVAVPAIALSGDGLPDPAPPPREAPAPERAVRVPPPWVLPPDGPSLRDDLVTTCSSPADEDFRSTTTVRAGCRTEVRGRRE